MATQLPILDAFATNASNFIEIINALKFLASNASMTCVTTEVKNLRNDRSHKVLDSRSAGGKILHWGAVSLPLFAP